MSDRESLDVRIYRRLVAASPELRPCADDVVETYVDLRRAAGRRAGRLGLALHFLRVVGPLLVLLLTTGRRREASSFTAALLAAADAWRRDARAALRGFARHPRYSLTVVAMIALGIAATTTVYSVVDAVILRRLPYPDADRLVLFTWGGHSGPLVERWRENLDGFDALTAVWDGDTMDLTGGVDRPERITAARVEPSFFRLFAARTLHGRPFVASELGGARVVVLGHSFWSSRFGADPGIVGTEIELDGEPWTVVGVLAPDPPLPEAVVGHDVDLLRPLDRTHPWMERWRFSLLTVVGRRSPGFSLEEAQAEVDVLMNGLADEQPRYRNDDGSAKTSPLVPLHRATVGDFRQGLELLLGSVAFMLAIACANLANLTLARGTDRENEMALRRALGADRLQLVRQLLIESTTLALVGGAAGLALTRGGLRLFDRLRPEDLPRFGEVVLDLRIAAVALGVSGLCGVLFGLTPALQAAGAEARRSLAGARRIGVGRSSSRLRSGLVVAEVALALVLLSAAGLLGHSLLGLVRTDPGFDPDGLARIDLFLGETLLGSEDEQAERTRFVDELVRRVGEVPGVEAVGAGWTVPFDVTGFDRCCWVAAFSRDPERVETREALIHPVTPGYLSTVGIPLLAGRALAAGDRKLEPPPIVLSREGARVLFPGVDDPVGRSLARGGDAEATVFRVVGLVDDVRHFGLDQEMEPAVYVPYGRWGAGLGELSLALRVRGRVDESTAEVLRLAIWNLDPDLPVGEVLPLDRMIWRSLRVRRFYSSLFGLFASIALGLAAFGLASSLLYTVGRRTREMGVRLASGARAVDLVRLIVGQALALTASGIAIGVLGTLAAGRALSSLVHGLGEVDPPSLIVAAATLAAVAIVASLLPALLAARTDPARALRSE